MPTRNIEVEQVSSKRMRVLFLMDTGNINRDHLDTQAARMYEKTDGIRMLNDCLVWVQDGALPKYDDKTIKAFTF